MIDFEKLATAIPANGMLKLLFTKKEDRITACVVQLFKGKEDNEHFAPLTLTGTAQELTEAFTKDIPELATLAETLYERLSASTVTANKKTAVTKAIAKTASKDEKEKDKTKPAEVKALPEPAPPPVDDLFSVRPKTPEPSQAEASERTDGEETVDFDDATEAAGGGL
jgi:PRTRC genetic system protein E